MDPAAAVTRATLYRWLNHDPAFQGAYNVWQKDLVTTAQGQLLAASQDAVVTVVQAIRRGDRQLAWKLLDRMGLVQPPAAGSTEVTELQRKQELDRKKAEVAYRKERSDLAEADASNLNLYESRP